MAFLRYLNRRGNIFVVSVSGGTPRQVTVDEHTIDSQDWTADGRELHYASDRSGAFLIWRVSTAGGEPRLVERRQVDLPVLPPKQRTANPENSERGRNARPSHVRRRWECAESADGKRLYYTKGRYVPGLWEMGLATGREAPIPELAEVVKKRYRAVTTDGVGFVSPDAWAIKFMDFKTRRIKNLARMFSPPVEGPAGLAVSPDQTMIVHAQSDQFGSTLTMVENFR